MAGVNEVMGMMDLNACFAAAIFEAHCCTLNNLAAPPLQRDWRVSSKPCRIDLGGFDD
jgi:hypothetical protein